MIPNKYKETDWKEVGQQVETFQDAIAKAAVEYGIYSPEVLEAQKTLIKSEAARKLSFKTVITNDGGKTPGVDGKVLGPEDFDETIQKLKNLRGYKCKPIRRVYILKADGVSKRPLGIPASIDRVWQALFNLALAPVVATVNCPHSYGFIKYRGCRDAITYLKACLNLRKGGKSISAPFVIEADIKGFFDSINHDWIMKNTPLPYKHFLEGWLKAGAMDKGKLYDTESGTPQGSLISPTIGNLVLSGLETVVRSALPDWIQSERRYVPTKDRKLGKKIKYARKVNVIRYADDFVVTCRNRYDAQRLIQTIDQFLKERGLILNKSKTKVTKVREGFDFLGFTFKEYDRGLLVTPSKKSVARLKNKIRDVLKAETLSALLIMRLNQILRGWATYFRISSSTRTFTKLGHFVWHRCFTWLESKYPKAGRRTLYRGHFSPVKTRTGNILMFSSEPLDRRLKEQGVRVSIVNIAGIRVIKLQKTSMKVSKHPFLLENKKYFEDLRRERALLYMDTQLIHAKLHKQQKGYCPICKEIIDETQKVEVDHINPISKGGEHTIKNLRLLHVDCHRLQVHGKKRNKTADLI